TTVPSTGLERQVETPRSCGRPPRLALLARQRAQVSVNLGDPLGEAGWTRLQDVRRLNLEDAVVADRGHAVPPRPVLNRRLLHLLAAPRREDHLRIAARDLRWIDDAVLGQAALRELGKNGIAAR